MKASTLTPTRTPLRQMTEHPGATLITMSAHLLPAPARTVAVVILTGCVALTGLLGARYTGRAHAGWLDTRLDARLIALLGHHHTILRLIRLGDPIRVAQAAALLVLLCLATRNWRGVALVAIAVPAAGVLAEFILKPLINRTMGGALAFPSGHATGVFALSVTFAVLLVAPPRPRIPTSLRATLALSALGATVVVGAAIAGAHSHYTTDVVGGAGVATAVVLLTALIIDRISADHRTACGEPQLDPSMRNP